MRIQGKVGSLQPGRGSLPEPDHAGRLPASKTVRNKFLFFINCSICGTLLEEPELTKTPERKGRREIDF